MNSVRKLSTHEISIHQHFMWQRQHPAFTNAPYEFEVWPTINKLNCNIIAECHSKTVMILMEHKQYIILCRSQKTKWEVCKIRLTIFSCALTIAKTHNLYRVGEFNTSYVILEIRNTDRRTRQLLLNAAQCSGCINVHIMKFYSASATVITIPAVQR